MEKMFKQNLLKKESEVEYLKKNKQILEEAKGNNSLRNAAMNSFKASCEAYF